METTAQMTTAVPVEEKQNTDGSIMALQLHVAKVSSFYATDVFDPACIRRGRKDIR